MSAERIWRKAKRKVSVAFDAASYLIRRLFRRLVNADEKYIICSPRGGLNDTLNQIERCRRLCIKSNRVLVLHTEESGLMCSFSSIFRLRRSFLVGCIDSCKRNCFAGGSRRFGDFEVAKSILSKNPVAYDDSRLKNFVFIGSGELAEITCEKAYGPERFLLDSQCGGGCDSHNLLRSLRLERSIRSRIRYELVSLPEEYFAIHVRNTDWQTPYKEFINSLKDRLKDLPVVICTDDPAVAHFASETLSDSNVLTTSALERATGRPLHEPWRYKNDSDKFNAITDSLVDLAVLAESKELFFANVAGGFPSGFSTLAMHLHRSKSLRRSFGISRS